MERKENKENFIEKMTTKIEKGEGRQGKGGRKIKITTTKSK